MHYSGWRLARAPGECENFPLPFLLSVVVAATGCHSGLGTNAVTQLKVCFETPLMVVGAGVFLFISGPTQTTPDDRLLEVQLLLARTMNVPAGLAGSSGPIQKFWTFWAKRLSSWKRVESPPTFPSSRLLRHIGDLLSGRKSQGSKKIGRRVAELWKD